MLPRPCPLISQTFARDIATPTLNGVDLLCVPTIPTFWAHADLAADPVTPTEISIAAVGAHIAGLPLNAELASRGGRFLEAITTTDAYRLYALAGGRIVPGFVVEQAGLSGATDITGFGG